MRAIAAAQRLGGTVYFGPGTWDLIDGHQPGLAANEGIVVPPGVRLLGAGSAQTRVQRHREWNDAPRAAFTLVGHTLVTGFTFSDLQVFQAGDQAGPFLQVGEAWAGVAVGGGHLAASSVAEEVVITRNMFDKPNVAIGGGGIPINRLFITYNTFGAYTSALELSGDQYNTVYKYRLDDSVIDHNIFKPGSKLDVRQKTGTLASELGRRPPRSTSAATRPTVPPPTTSTRQTMREAGAPHFFGVSPAASSRCWCRRIPRPAPATRSATRRGHLPGQQHQYLCLARAPLRPLVMGATADTASPFPATARRPDEA